MTPAATTLSDLSRIMLEGAKLEEQSRAAKENEFLQGRQVNQQGQASRERNQLLGQELAQREKLALLPYAQQTVESAARNKLLGDEFSFKRDQMKEQSSLTALQILAQLDNAMSDPDELAKRHKVIDLDVANQVAEANRRLEPNKSYFHGRDWERARTDVSDLPGVVWDAAQDKYVEKYGYRSGLLPKPSSETAIALRQILRRRAGLPEATLSTPPPAAPVEVQPDIAPAFVNPFGETNAFGPPPPTGMTFVPGVLGGQQLVAPAPAQGRFRIIPQ